MLPRYDGIQGNSSEFGDIIQTHTQHSELTKMTAEAALTKIRYRLIEFIRHRFRL